MTSAVEAEEKFLQGALSVDLIGMNAALMREYIRYTADVILGMFGYPAKFLDKNPFQWMDMLAIENKTNFFEHTPTEYKKASSIDFGIADDF